MLNALLVGLPTMMLCLLVQSLLLVAALRFYAARGSLIDSPSFCESLIVVNGVMLILVIGNLGQVTIWAMLFHALGEFESLQDSLYHSAVNFATLGYGDIVMSEERRFLGPLEAINGGLMIGMSTATLMAAFQHAMKRTLSSRAQ